VRAPGAIKAEAVVSRRGDQAKRVKGTVCARNVMSLINKQVTRASLEKFSVREKEFTSQSVTLRRKLCL